MRWVWAAAGCTVAAVLAAAAVQVNLHRLCVIDDMPYLGLCPELPPDQQLAALRERVARNPGDSDAWVRMVPLERDGPRAEATLNAARTLAPNDSNVLRWLADDAIRKDKAPEAVALLVRLIHHHAHPGATQALARVVALVPGSAELLKPHLPTAGGWLPRVLTALWAQKLPPETALPLVIATAPQGMLPAWAVHSYMGTLRSGGLWLEAYSLWVALNGGKAPLLYNGGFERPFVPNGFDWEVIQVPPSRAGATVEQRPLGTRGNVLEVNYNGKPVVTPVVRQYILATPGTYRVRGAYMAQRLRMNEGLAWALRCTGGGKALAGRSEGLQDTQGVWTPFQFDVTVPPDCGVVASLQLETHSPYEARTGFKGRAVFDALELKRAEP